MFRNWIRKHKTALLVSAGAAGVGYFCYKCIKAHYTSVQEREAQISFLQQAELRAESQLQSHFQTVQRISDMSALPTVVPHLKTQLLDQTDLSGLTAKLFQGKDSPHMLSGEEKLELWETLKILSFSRGFSSMCSLTLMVLLVRVQFNVLARHVYIDTARDISIVGPGEQGQGLSTRFQQNYLAFAEFLPHEGLGLLIRDIKGAVEEVVGVKTLREPCTLGDLGQIFASIEKCLLRNQTTWTHYMLPQDMKLSKDLLLKSLGVDDVQYEAEELFSFENDERMRGILEETKAILDSKEFEEILALSLAVVIEQFTMEFDELYQEWKTSSIPLAKLIPHVARLAESFLDHPDENRFVQTLIKLPQLQSFCAMVYAAGQHQMG
ncbi:hypothetical protein GOP47_0017912 [Adiantum capillus-veneris]|uniref:Uncharacterized protein n=1 Tax=Adiantum capillus-veneris TaxID=13818 RepID=A0A9D4UGB2_ADICA|nr:hypothetical protein GOP47_0017912 [Adiantum capillus-veneris]